MELISQVIAYLTEHPEETAAIVTLVGSLWVALSNAGGERFALIKRLVRLLTGDEKPSK